MFKSLIILIRTNWYAKRTVIDFSIGTELVDAFSLFYWFLFVSLLSCYLKGRNLRKLNTEYFFFRSELIKGQSCYHIETSPLICSTNQLTGFYMMVTLAFNELSSTSIQFRFIIQKRSKSLQLDQNHIFREIQFRR